MIYLNLQTQLLRSPECIGSDPVARATWLWVLAYCCEQENGGRIVGARAWKDRQWQQACGVTLAEVMASAPLLTWEGDDLLVWAYPLDKEEEVKAKREIGRRGGSARTEAKARAARINGGGQAEPKQKPSAEPTEGQEKEGESKDKAPELVLIDAPEIKRPRKDKADLAEVLAFFESEKLPKQDAEWFFHKCEGNGWTNGGKPIKNWRATVRSWRAAKFLPSQRPGAPAAATPTIIHRPQTFVR